MELKYGPNKITTETKTISLDTNTTTLIGENGSGKSTILEQLLENYFDDEKSIISYSSGLNQSFSVILNKKIDNFNKELTDEGIGKNINSFYFTSEWASLLIYFAYFLEKGKTKDFLDNHNYFKGKELKLNFSINNDTYKRYISTAKEKEELNGTSLISSKFHKSLKALLENSFTGGRVIGEIDFEEKLNIKDGFLNNDIINSIFIINEEIENDDGELERISDEQRRNLRNKELLSFLGIISKYILPPENTKLYIGDIEINGLSDGEFQLLTIYSLLDLFDGENTIFLFDEVDSHLHYKNINILWEKLKSVKGKVITTTHIPDSIINNDINNIKLVEKGVINNDNTANTILKRLDNISDKSIYEIRLMRKIKNIVLIDDLVDWKIFLKLVEKKLGKDELKKIENLTVYKRTSSYNDTNEIFGKSKLMFVDDFKKNNEKNNIDTENIFLICDRDKLPLTEIKENLEVQIKGDYNKIKSFGKTKTYLLSWKRLEIENYLLYKNLLIENKKFPHFNYKDLDSLDGIEDIAILDCKDITHPLYKDKGFNENKLDDLISKIPKEEISEDIEKMHNFIISKL